MQRMRLVPALLLAATSILAWTSPKLEDVVNSAPGPNSQVLVHVDVTGPHPYQDMMSARLFYSTNNQASWTELPMTAVNQPGYDSTFQASFPISGSGTVYYYVRANDTFGYATQSPYNAANTWPPGYNLLAELADEPSGDAINNPDGPWLDLTGIWMGYSSDHLYARLTNDHNSWPVGSIITDWYMYSVGFRNPDAPQDTFAFVMGYGNVLGIYTPGLYSINAYTEEIERFADIDYQTDGNTLTMRCLISDLVAHPKFGPWPIPSGLLRACRGDTRSVNWQAHATLHDTTNQSRFYLDRTPVFTIGQNHPPTLSDDRVVPDTGTSSTEFWFSVRYFDQDSNLATVRKLVVDTDTFDLIPNHHRYWAGVRFELRRSGFEAGLHWFHFVLDDGMGIVSTTPDTFRVFGTGVTSRPASDPLAFHAAPNPFVSAVELQVPPSCSRLAIADCTGRLVRLFDIRSLVRRIVWDGLDQHGSSLPAGVYYCHDPAWPNRRLRLVRLTAN